MAKKSKGQEDQAPAEAEKPSARASFLPEAPAPDAPVRVETQVADAKPVAESEPPKRAEGIALEIRRLDERNVLVTLTIPPLNPRVEKIFLPIKYSQEELASITAGAIERAARGAVTDGIFQHAKREEEDAKTREAMKAR